jgi:hypothetical protein
MTTTPGRVLLLLALLGQIAVRNQGYEPFSDEPISYRTTPVNDPVARLQQRVDRGEVRLEYDEQHGYLKSVLRELHIPISSQSLVFSKTSFQFRKISPQTPRALYFNDDVYVGWVNQGRKLELVSFDAKQGAMFYLLDQEEPTDRPLFERAELDCTQCHVAAPTRGVPGVLVRSITTTPKGTQAVGSPAFISGHESPLTERFGGWYVTGSAGRQTHMGSTTLPDTAAYLTGHSDIVAQLVQQHQTQMHNLITLTNYRTRIALHAGGTREQYEAPAEELLRYLLFANEAPFTDNITGTSSFAEEFSALGPRDKQGRSLRDFDLHTRLFKYPCSYLIYSESFDALPEPAKSYISRRLAEILTGRDRSADFARLTATDRRAILDILLATKPDLLKGTM